MNRILLVEEHPQLFASLKEAASLAPPLDVSRTDTASTLIQELQRRDADVLVLHLGCPLDEIQALLKCVQQSTPDVIRIVLLPTGSEQDALRMGSLIHHLLADSSPAAAVLQAIHRSLGLKRLLRSPELQSLVLAVDHLPAVPELYLQLQKMLTDPEIDGSRIARMIERDPGMAAELLHMANSAFLGRSRQIFRVEDAVVYLGYEAVRTLVLSCSLFRQFQGAGNESGFEPENLQRHSLLTAQIAMQLIPRRRRDMAFIAGILHDIGILLLADRLPGEYERLQNRARTREIPLHLVEQEEWGVTHAELGGYLLDLWGLPQVIVEAVCHHHIPVRVQPVDFDVLAAVHVADTLAEDAGLPAVPGIPHPSAESATGYLACFGLAQRLPGWQRVAESQAHLMLRRQA